MCKETICRLIYWVKWIQTRVCNVKKKNFSPRGRDLQQNPMILSKHHTVLSCFFFPIWKEEFQKKFFPLQTPHLVNNIHTVSPSYFTILLPTSLCWHWLSSLVPPWKLDPLIVFCIWGFFALFCFVLFQDQPEDLSAIDSCEYIW